MRRFAHAHRKPRPDLLLFVFDIVGTFVFGIEGAMAATRADLDFFGIMVLAFSTALAGGVIRDLLIGAVPPASIRDWRYPAVAFTGGAAVFFFYHFAQSIPLQVIVVFDAAGLALFAIAGAQKALDYEINPFMATLMGTITGVGGGTVRDIFLAQVPAVLRTDIYATAAFAGAAVMMFCRRIGLHPTVSAIIGGIFCFAFRLVAVWRHWNLPRVSMH